MTPEADLDRHQEESRLEPATPKEIEMFSRAVDEVSLCLLRQNTYYPGEYRTEEPVLVTNGRGKPEEMNLTRNLQIERDGDKSVTTKTIALTGFDDNGQETPEFVFTATFWHEQIVVDGSPMGITTPSKRLVNKDGLPATSLEVTQVTRILKAIKDANPNLIPVGVKQS